MNNEEIDDVVSASQNLEKGSEEDALEDKQEADFVVVKSRRTRKNNRNVQTFQHDVKQPPEEILCRPVTEKRQEVLKKINLCKQQLQESPYFKKFLESIRESAEKVTGSSSYPDQLQVFCLGLGPFSSHLLSRIARYQLALLLLIREEVGAVVEVFDPIFIQEEKSILVEEFDFLVTEINEEGKRKIETSTIVFMPHCPHQLVNNFLFANWNPDSLSKCFLVCNSISEAVQTISPKYVQENLKLISSAHSICLEIPLPNIFKDQPDIFNDLSLHVFPPKNFHDLSESFWTDVTCPVYSEQDFISSN